MFIFWGSYNSDRDRGVVGDRCPNCGRVTTLLLTQRYRVPHVYFIPLGSGELLATLLTCCECRGQVITTMDRYRKTLPKHAGREMSTEEILEQTNPRLTESLRHRARLEKEARQVGQVAPGANDPRIELAFTRLADLNPQDPQVIALQSQLVQWSTLEDSVKSQLLRTIESVWEEQMREGAALRFLTFMAQLFKPEVDPGLAILTFLLTAGFGIAAVLYFTSEIAAVIGVIAALALAFVCAALAQRKVRLHLHRKFFRKTFLPEAYRQGISLSSAIALLQMIDSGDQTYGGLAQATPLLHEVLQEANADGAADLADALARFADAAPRTPHPLAPKWIAPVAMLAVVVVFVGGVLWIKSVQDEEHRADMERRHAYLAPFVARLPEYIPAGLQRELQQPYRHGKLLPVKMPNKEIDWIIFDLPQHLRPAAPEEVGTIAWLEWGSEQVAVYTDGQPALVVLCKLTLIDKSKSLIVAEKEFRGGPPPQQRQNHQANHGSFPTGDIVAWIGSLPVK